MNVGILLSSSGQSLFLQEAGSHNDLSAVAASQIESSDTVLVGSVVAVGGLIVLVGLVVVGSIQLNAVISALVEGLVLQLTHVGDESDLILAIGRGHLVSDLIGIGDSGGTAFGFLGIGVVGGAGSTANEQAGYHNNSQQCAEPFLHFLFLQYFFGIKIPWFYCRTYSRKMQYFP